MFDLYSQGFRSVAGLFRSQFAMENNGDAPQQSYPRPDFSEIARFLFAMQWRKRIKLLVMLCGRRIEAALGSTGNRNFFQEDSTFVLFEGKAKKDFFFMLDKRKIVFALFLGKRLGFLSFHDVERRFRPRKRLHKRRCCHFRSPSYGRCTTWSVVG